MKGFPFDSNLHLKRRCSGVIWQPIFLDLSQSEKLSEINPPLINKILPESRSGSTTVCCFVLFLFEIFLKLSHLIATKFAQSCIS